MSDMPYIQFYPTLRCNANCDFCFNKGLRATDDVKVKDFQIILSALKAAGIRCIDFLGGEPTLHPDLMTLLDMIQAQQMTSNLSSNGTNINILNALSEKYDKDFLRIGISLQAFEQSGDLHEYIIRHRPILKSVSTKSTMIPDGCERYIGLSGIEYFLLYMDALDKNDLANSLPFYLFHQRLSQLKNVYPGGLEGVSCAGFVSHRDNLSRLRTVRCPAGTTKLSLSADGSVYPCYLFFRYREFELGNILRDDFQKIWQNPILDYFRIFSHNACPNKGCVLFSSCHGGCPALSYLFYDDLAAPDPRCMRKEGE